MEYFLGNELDSSIKDAINKKEFLCVPSVCIYEVYKKMQTDKGIGYADIVIGVMQNGTNVVNLDEEIAKTAAIFSKKHKLPMADSVIYATAKTYNAIIWTQDKHFEGLNSLKYFSKTRKN
jgi:PIN domain nuclease of toxin-antitoxin system